MKITFEFDTESETFQPDELLRMQKSLDMAGALWELSGKIRVWWESTNAVDSDQLHTAFCEILQEYGLDLDKLYQ
jgi:hypothetical protein